MANPISQTIPPRIVQNILIVSFVILMVGGCSKPETLTSTVTSPDTQPGQIAKTLYGDVKAEQGSSNTWVWKAIPYAKPPMGSLRWKTPQNPVSWKGIREKKEFCEVCPQYNFNGKIIGDEDCLYLNIWRPRSQAKNLPVYFWIHGGGNSIQMPYLSAFSGSEVANKSNMIVVTVNYRVGPFGWFAHPALRTGKKGDEYNDSGNFGTLDLVKALEWVRDNITGFGGDPGNVFINGESAGGVNVLTLLISPAAKGLFHKAMSQSGGQRSKKLFTGDASTETVIAKLFKKENIAADERTVKVYLKEQPKAQIEDFLRSKSTAEILGCYQAGFAGMLVDFPYNFEDGNLIPLSGFDTLKTGTYQQFAS